MFAVGLVEHLRRVLDQHLREAVDRDEGRAQVVRDRVRESLELFIQHLELGVAPVDLRGALRNLTLEVREQVGRLDGNGGAVGERLQELGFGFRGTVLSGPINTDRPDGGDRADRCHDEALYERRAVCVVRNARVEVNVLDDRRLTIQHRPAADARLKGKSLALPQRPDRVLLRVKTLIAITKDETRAICMYQGTRCMTHDVHDGRQVASERESLHNRHQLLHALDDIGGRRRCCSRRR